MEKAIGDPCAVIVGQHSRATDPHGVRQDRYGQGRDQED